VGVWQSGGRRWVVHLAKNGTSGQPLRWTVSTRPAPYQMEGAKNRIEHHRWWSSFPVDPVHLENRFLTGRDYRKIEEIVPETPQR